RHRCRLKLCSTRINCLRSTACLLCHPAAARRKFVRTAAKASLWPARAAAQEGMPAAETQQDPNQLCNPLDEDRHVAVVWRPAVLAEHRHRHRPLVPYRIATGGNSLGACTRPVGRARASSLPVYQPQRHAGADPWLVRSALVHGDHITGDPRASRRRDPAAMVGPSNPADHPALLGLFSLITIWVNTSSKLSQSIRPRDAAWYAKSELTFSDAIAAVRRVLWAHPNISMSGKPRDMVKIPRPLFDRFTQTLCYAT